MKIKCYESIYKTDIKTGLFIVGQTFWLKKQRLLRCGKRIFRYVMQQWIVLLCAIFFTLLTVPIGIEIGKYLTWIDGVWDLKLFYLTSIFIVSLTSIINSEKARHETLVSQYNTYSSLIFESENFIHNFCKITDYAENENNNIF